METLTRCHLCCFQTTNMAQNFDEVSQGIEAENVDIDDVGISSDEEEDMDRCMFL